MICSTKIIVKRTRIFHRNSLKENPNQDIIVFQYRNSSSLLITRTIANLLEFIRTLNVNKSVSAIQNCDLKYAKPQSRGFSSQSAVTCCQYFEQHGSGKEHCSIKKLAKTIESRKLKFFCITIAR